GTEQEIPGAEGFHHHEAATGPLSVPGVLDEQVALAPDRLDLLGLAGVVAQLLAQPRNADVHGAIQAVIFDTAYVVEDVVPAQHRAGVACQVPQEFELLGGEIQHFAVPADFVRLAVDAQPAEAELLGLLALLALAATRAAQEGAQARQQHRGLNGLVDE